jgi:hypothetical protein
MGKKVIYAKLHDGFFIPVVGNMKDTLPSDGKTLKDFEMELQDGGGLMLSWTGLDSKSTPVTKRYFIGAATVKGVLLEDSPILKSKYDK